MLSNREISRLFYLYAELLLVHRQDEKLSGQLSGAAYRLRNLERSVLEFDKKELSKNFQPAIARLITELKSKDTLDILDELIQLTPAGLFEMMRIKGLGGKKLAILWHQAKIDSVDALLEACQKDKLKKIPGFGAKTQQNIIQAIETYRSAQQRFHLASVADDADTFLGTVRKILKTKMISLCGEIRRQCNTVPGIEIITSVPASKFKSRGLKKILIIETSKKERTTGHTIDEIPVIIHHVASKNFVQQLFKLTGNLQHVEKVQAKIKTTLSFKSEEDIYKKAGLPYIPPELREDNAEWKYKENELLQISDIRGVVHNHTTWSDGVDSLKDFVVACKQKKYEYTVIAEHSKNAHYAGGLKEEKVLKQQAEIDKLNKELAPFQIFKSIECDILVSGELDFDKSLLKKFDMVIVSIHQLLKMDEERATKRLIKAIENPYTTMLGHPTGRQLLIRPGYPVNMKKMIDACAANGVIIEINANPYRLDMDWSYIPYATKKRVMISVNPDAHSIAEIDNIRWGVISARKGGLTKAMTWNAMSVNEVERELRKKK